MTQHHLQGRSDTELLWFQRRGFLQAASASFPAALFLSTEAL